MQSIPCPLGQWLNIRTGARAAAFQMPCGAVDATADANAEQKVVVLSAIRDWRCCAL